MAVAMLVGAALATVFAIPAMASERPAAQRAGGALVGLAALLLVLATVVRCFGDDEG